MMISQGERPPNRPRKGRILERSPRVHRVPQPSLPAKSTIHVEHPSTLLQRWCQTWPDR
jgi:hypothetical protein